jgi:hypothetical protein
MSQENVEIAARWLEANAVPTRALSSVQLDALARKWVEA